MCKTFKHNPYAGSCPCVGVWHARMFWSWLTSPPWLGTLHLQTQPRFWSTFSMSRRLEHAETQPIGQGSPPSYPSVWHVLKASWVWRIISSMSRIVNSIESQTEPWITAAMPRHVWHFLTDRGKKECVDPEGNGVTMNERAEGGPGPPSGE